MLLQDVALPGGVLSLDIKVVRCALEQFQEFVEKHHALARTDVNAAQLFPVHLGNAAGPPRGAVQRGIVLDHYFSIARQAHIALDAVNWQI